MENIVLIGDKRDFRDLLVQSSYRLGKLRPSLLDGHSRTLHIFVTTDNSAVNTLLHVLLCIQKVIFSNVNGFGLEQFKE